MKMQQSLVGLALLWSTAKAAKSQYDVPRVGFQALVDEPLSKTLANAVHSEGMFQVTDVPELGLLRRKTLESAAACAAHEDIRIKSSLPMEDGTIRSTFGSANKYGESLDMDFMAEFPKGGLPEACTEFVKHSTALRDVVTLVSNQVVRQLDVMCGSEQARGAEIAQSTLGGGYSDLSDFVSNGVHLEHFHAYQANCEPSSNKQTLEMHVDEGLFIGVVPSMWMNSQGTSMSTIDPAHGFYVQTSSGVVAQPMFAASGDVILFMMGGGVDDWFSTCKVSMRSVPHSLVLSEACSLLEGQTSPLRMWYGRMFLPPPDALVTTSGKAFKDHRHDMAKESTSQNADAGISVGCSGGRHLLDENVTVCDKSAGEFLCWMKCRPFPVGEGSTCTTETPDEDFICSDPATGELWDGVTHCKTCVLSCKNSTRSPTTAPTSDSFLLTPLSAFSALVIAVFFL